MKHDAGKQQTRAASAPAKSYEPVRDPDNRPSAGRTRSVDHAMNGSMVQDFADAQRLGQYMSKVKTSRELRDEGLVPDPIQY